MRTIKLALFKPTGEGFTKADYFKDGMPLATLALAATAVRMPSSQRCFTLTLPQVQYQIDQFEEGVAADRQFTKTSYKSVYQRHMERLKNMGERAPEVVNDTRANVLAKAKYVVYSPSYPYAKTTTTCRGTVDPAAAAPDVAPAGALDEDDFAAVMAARQTRNAAPRTVAASGGTTEAVAGAAVTSPSAEAAPRGAASSPPVASSSRLPE